MGTTISDLKAKAFYQMDIGNVSKNSGGQKMESFSDVFVKTQGTEQNPKSKTESSVKKEDTESIQNHANIQKNKSSETLKEKNEEVENEDTINTFEDEIVQAANTVVQSIAEIFNVSVEEVENVLENLGLTALDLLNMENLTQVVLALNPDCDAMTLMTNEQLFADLKTLQNDVQNLRDQIVENFNLSQEDMNNILNTMKVNLQGEISAEQTTAVDESIALTEVASLKALEKTEVPVEVSVTKDADMKDEKEINNRSLEKDTTDTAEITKTEVNQKDVASNDSKGNFADIKGESYQNPAQNFMNQLAEAVDDVNQTTASYGVRGQDIINQITEQIRIHVTQETTEMELQLHPASLGNVKVQIASTGGVLTAVFTTENEAVKAALESQLVQLKENFTEQGLKVESVEVNVSAQGFERSLDQQEQEQSRFDNNRNKKSGRRIRLEGTEEVGDILETDMSGEDKIVADMMIRNGNTVDYMV